MAAKCFDKAIKVNPNLSDPYMCSAKIKFDKLEINANCSSEVKGKVESEYRKIVKDIEDFIQKNPNDSNSYYTLGVFAQQMGKIKPKYYYRAIDYYEKAIDLDPDNFMAYYNWGLIRENFEEDHYEALQFYQRVLEINPDFVDAKISMATIYMKENDYKEASTILFKLISEKEAQDNIYVLYNNGLLWMKFVRFNKAMGYFMDIIKKYSNDSKNYSYQLVNTYLQISIIQILFQDIPRA